MVRGSYFFLFLFREHVSSAHPAGKQRPDEGECSHRSLRDASISLVSFQELKTIKPLGTRSPSPTTANTPSIFASPYILSTSQYD